MPEDHRPYSASYLILKKEGKFLLMKRKNTGFKDGMYSLVSGHVDEGENFKDAMIREAKEEVGIEIEKEELKATNVIHRKSEGRTYVDIFFQAEKWEGQPENMEPKKCSKISWFHKEEIPENIVDYVEYVIEDLNTGMTYEEKGWE
jgi:ADP-ribose pyrophosphatase YjhB (NUDIX family)